MVSILDFFTATESAGMAVVYTLIVEMCIHRELKFKNIPKILRDTTEMVGMLFLILVIAVSLNKFMTYEQIPQALVETLSQIISSPIEFLIGVNILFNIYWVLDGYYECHSCLSSYTHSPSCSLRNPPHSLWYYYDC